MVFGLLLLWMQVAQAAPPPSAPVGESEAMRTARMLQRGSMGRFTALGSGDSMRPIYGDGTVILYQQVPFDELEKGMTVAFRNRKGVTVTHKLVGRNGYGWMAKGLNNRRVDADRVTPQNLLGVVYLVLYTQDT